jgi:hypothetical protein
MAILFVLIAGVLYTISNYAMRRSIDGGGTTSAFIVVQMFSAALAAVLFNPVWTGEYSVNQPIAFFALGTGALLGILLFSLGKAIERGPPGFTFAMLNSGSVFPGLIMALLFGASYGFIYNLWHGIGSLIVLLGLFWGARQVSQMKDFRSWWGFSMIMFFLNIAIFCLMQFRAMLLNLPHPEEMVSFFSSERICSQWFTPLYYLGAALTQSLIFFPSEKRLPQKQEFSTGIWGGISNSAGTFFLLKSTEVAVGVENAIIFPILSVSVIVLTNWWGQKLYQEKVNWFACALCVFGLVIGTVDWSAVFSS